MDKRLNSFQWFFRRSCFCLMGSEPVELTVICPHRMIWGTQHVQPWRRWCNLVKVRICGSWLIQQMDIRIYWSLVMSKVPNIKEILKHSSVIDFFNSCPKLVRVIWNVQLGFPSICWNRVCEVAIMCTNCHVQSTVHRQKQYVSIMPS